MFVSLYFPIRITYGTGIFFPPRAVCAGNALTLVISAYTKKPIEQKVANWPSEKPETHFGQLPLATIGGITLCQSNAIARLQARQAGLLGDTDADYARSEEVSCALK